MSRLSPYAPLLPAVSKVTTVAVRPYWLVDDIDAAVAAAVKAGGQLAVPPMEIPGHGTFAIYLQGGNDHGLWQL